LRKAQARALQLAGQAVKLDPSSPQTHWAMGFVRLFRQEFEEAAASAQMAVALAPNYADGYGLLAFINNFRGQAEDAVRQIEKAMALNPNYTYTYPWNLGRAFYALGRYRDAIETLQQALNKNENAAYPRLFLAASYVRAGLHDDAAWEIEQVRVLNPDMTITHLRNTFPIADKDALRAFLDDLEEAGLPKE
jgi:tetratricopeptide (TPR) repeat protein